MRSSAIIQNAAQPIALFAMGLLSLGFVWYSLSTWIIDDAGISLAFATSLRHGLGLVPQQGTVPVEGFSNLLWVLTLVPLADVATPALMKTVGSAFFLAAILRLTTGLQDANAAKPVAYLAPAVSSHAKLRRFSAF